MIIDYLAYALAIWCACGYAAAFLVGVADNIGSRSHTWYTFLANSIAAPFAVSIMMVVVFGGTLGDLIHSIRSIRK